MRRMLEEEMQVQWRATLPAMQTVGGELPVLDQETPGEATGSGSKAGGRGSGEKENYGFI
ncbi:hypothetical protein Esi_0099_0013 [Ectocarpus siliculosus]|uniref:Uncharacterized protein n=1 Tax=Ectocarpus siliculosus TaxID=2880 RepID=D8LU86_ECTSI|nr:hypothetical protein Esi_0099_0013 [Ectocarpus siliculosus]|eukprot:CBN75427.1 hypothetical protein Esi_0099_0013 [Ectocarpus siliculosus]